MSRAVSDKINMNGSVGFTIPLVGLRSDLLYVQNLLKSTENLTYTLKLKIGILDPGSSIEHPGSVVNSGKYLG
jgi:hypothetical protein